MDDRRVQPDRRALPRRREAGRRAVDMNKIACPRCGDGRSRVVDTRPFHQRDGVYRLRQCVGCDNRYTTEELVSPVYPSGAKRTRKSSDDDLPSHI